MVDVLTRAMRRDRIRGAAAARRRRSARPTARPTIIGRLVLEHIDFTLRDGEIVAILGKSGSGKSTFLRILAGLVPPSEGRVEYRGVPVAEPVRGIAMVFQSLRCFPG